MTRRLARRLLLSFALCLTVSFPVSGSGQSGDETDHSCSNVPWPAKIESDDWEESRSIPQDGAKSSTRVFANDAGEKVLVIGFYFSIHTGQIKIVKQGARYNALYSYQVHNDSMKPIDGPNVLVSASYDPKHSAMPFYCYEIVEGLNDIEKNPGAGEHEERLGGILGDAQVRAATTGVRDLPTRGHGGVSPGGRIVHAPVDLPAYVISGNCVNTQRLANRASLNAAGCPCGRVMTPENVLEDPQVRAQEMVIEYQREGRKAVRMTGFPLKFTATPCELRFPAPELGEHGD